jgi:S-DNA-T family DNA segregation ATPase FtsK/SpoIIIE
MLIRTFLFLSVFSSIFLVIALFSYQSVDPALLIASNQLNAGGAIGAALADFLFLHLGIASYLVPFLILYQCLCYIFKKSFKPVISFLFFISIIFYSQFYESFFSKFFVLENYPASLGGWLGEHLVQTFSLWLGSLGSLTLIHLFFLQSVNELSENRLWCFAVFCLKALKKIPYRKVIPTASQKTLKKQELDFSETDEKVDLNKAYSQKERQEWIEQGKLLSAQLEKYGIENKVTEIVPGPVIIRFQIQLASGERSSKVVTLTKDLARALLIRDLNVLENIPGSSSIGIEVPQKKRQIISLEPLLKCFDSSFVLPLVLGVKTQLDPVIVDLAKMPHLLVAGSTGSGKSVGIASMLLSLLQHQGPESVKFVLIDPKVLEFARYEKLAHLALPVICDHHQALAALLWAVDVMEKRYRLMAEKKVRHISEYRKLAKSNKSLVSMPYLVIVIDELADLMMLSKKAIEQPIARLTQKARACGIHLIIATQRPSVDVITGLIKSNVPARLSYAVSSKIDSRTILDKSGAEHLLGMGDAYFSMPGFAALERVHGAFISDERVEKMIKPYLVDKPHYLANLDHIVEALEQE